MAIRFDSEKGVMKFIDSNAAICYNGGRSQELPMGAHKRERRLYNPIMSRIGPNKEARSKQNLTEC